MFARLAKVADRQIQRDLGRRPARKSSLFEHSISIHPNPPARHSARPHDSAYGIPTPQHFMPSINGQN
jgi:hypothetical protein